MGCQLLGLSIQITELFIRLFSKNFNCAIFFSLAKIVFISNLVLHDLITQEQYNISPRFCAYLGFFRSLAANPVGVEGVDNGGG